MKKQTLIAILILLCIVLFSGCATKPAVPDVSPPVTADDAAADIPSGTDLLARAGKDDLLAVLTDQDSAEYTVFNNAGAQSYVAQPGGDPIILVPLKDGLNIQVISVEYTEDGNLSWGESLLEFTGCLGEPVKLTAFLSEGIPSLLLYASYNDLCANWYISYDSIGTDAVRFLTAEALYGVEE